MRPKEYQPYEIFKNAYIGLIFEFFSSKDIQFIRDDLSKILEKAVVITEDPNSSPTFSSSILFKEYGENMCRYQLKIAMESFSTIKPMIISILKFINGIGNLDYSTKLIVDLFFDHRILQTLSAISNMDISKMILKIDENFFYNRFPMSKISPLCLSVEKFFPYYQLVSTSLSLSNLKNNLSFPISENYGIDFTRQPMGILRFNYIVGNYAENPNYVNEAIEYYIITTYKVLNSSGIDPEMEYKLDNIGNKYSSIRDYYNDPEIFLKRFPNIKVYVNLSGDISVIRTYWSRIRTNIMKLILQSDLKKGSFNLDTDLGLFEIKDAEIFNAIIKDFNIVRCKISSSILDNCYFYICNINNSKIDNSKIISGNKIEKSFINNSIVNKSNIIDKSYIVNNGKILNCKVNSSVVKDANLGKDAKLDENTILIKPSYVSPPLPKKGIEVDGVRDYNWIKSMRKTPDEGFANYYKSKY